MTRVTVIDGDVSWPASSGKRLRTLNLLLGLAKDFEITYIGRAERRDREAEIFFRDHRIAPVLVQAPLKPKQGAGLYARLLINTLDPLPYSVRSHQFNQMRAAAQAHSEQRPPDVWQLEWLGYHSCVAAETRPVVLQAHNVDTLIWQRYAEVETNPFKRAALQLQHMKMARYEAQVFKAVDRVVAVSRADADKAAQLFGDVTCEVVDNGVDTDFFGQVKRSGDLKTVLFLGALDWRPNLDALDVLLSQIWPMVLAEMPEARLQIVGRNPPEALAMRVQGTPNATLHADVPDVRPYLAEAAAMAVPLRIGGGSRLKILEALSAGVPVVSTAIGAEGLELDDRRHFTRAETPKAFAAALRNAMLNQTQSNAQAASGRAFVNSRHDWSVLSQRLGGIWESAHRAHRTQGARHVAANASKSDPASWPLASAPQHAPRR